MRAFPQSNFLGASPELLLSRALPAPCGLRVLILVPPRQMTTGVQQLSIFQRETPSCSQGRRDRGSVGGMLHPPNSSSAGKFQVNFA